MSIRSSQKQISPLSTEARKSSILSFTRNTITVFYSFEESRISPLEKKMQRVISLILNETNKRSFFPLETTIANNSIFPLKTRIIIRFISTLKRKLRNILC